MSGKSSLRISSFTTRGSARAEPPSPTNPSDSDHVEDDDLPSTSTAKPKGKAGRAASAASSSSSTHQSAAQKRKAVTFASEHSPAKRANGVVKKTEAAAADSSSSSTAPSSTKAAASSSRAAQDGGPSGSQKPAEEQKDHKEWMRGEGEPACPECGTIVAQHERTQHFRCYHFTPLYSSPRARKKCSKLELYLGQRVGVAADGPRQCRACPVEPESRVKLLAHYRKEHQQYYYVVYNGYWERMADIAEEDVEDRRVYDYLDLPTSRPFSLI